MAVDFSKICFSRQHLLVQSEGFSFMVDAWLDETVSDNRHDVNVALSGQ